MQVSHWLIPVSASFVAASASAGTVTVNIENLRSDAGVIRVAICPEDRFTEPTCPWVGSAPAAQRRVSVQDVPEGTYAVQAFHDEDGDGDLDRRGFRPSEGLGFSNDARMRFGPPKFEDAAVQVRGDSNLTINMRYFQ